jgi:hypothetical protein
MSEQMINGRHHAWSDITINAASPAPLLDVVDIEYSDTQQVDEQYGKGRKARGYGLGNYQSTGKLKMKRREWEKLKLILSASGGGRILDHAPFPITVSYAATDVDPIVTDVLSQCKLTGTGTQAAQGDTTIEVEIPFKILGGITWNGTPSL